MNFNSFQNLYQQVKIYDMRLFECFRLIEEYIKNIANVLPDSSDFTKPKVVFQAGDVTLTTGTQLISSLSLVLPVEGSWLIEYNGVLLVSPADFGVQMFITYGAPSVSSPGGRAVIDTIYVANQSSAANIAHYVSKSWIYTATSANTVIQFQGRKVSGTGGSIAVSHDGFGNACSSLKAIYLGNYGN